MDINQLFSGVEKKKLAKALEAADKRVKPVKISKFEYTKAGQYNAIALPVVPHAVVTVTDAGKGKLDWTLIGQQIVAARRFSAPVVVEYITAADQNTWGAAFIAAVQIEVDK